MAIFNLEYYSGKNLYSDGSVEDVIMDIVKTGQEYTNYVDCEDYYPIMYHLSPERENILNWYPLKKTDAVLEIGSGCGAITGLLCRQSEWVTSVELSRKRAEINYERHKEYDNLEIAVGNLNDMNLKRKYDYVILNGVFEYAASFTDSHEPYITFLNNLKKYLKQDGRILISIENRLGIKYFSGAMEDHTNEYFLGLINYADNNTVRTFSKTELERIFQACGMNKWKFYYPYPDYKFPTEIFTDENIDSDNYGRGYRNYQKGRVELFNELDMIQTFKKESIMGSFSNSFLAEVCVNNTESSNVLYAKLNNMRKSRFCISTVIMREEYGDKVRKKALNENARMHINDIYANQGKALPGGLKYLQGNINGDAVEYPYLQLECLDAYILRRIRDGKVEEVQEKIDGLYSILSGNASVVEHIYSGQFREFFGEVRYSGAMQCIRECDIDLIFDNLYLDGDGYTVIDPEWICPFWVPVQFIMWRMLNEWYAKHLFAEELLPSRKLYARYGIDEDMEKVFRQWAIYFATKYVSETDLDKAVIQIKSLDLNHLVQKELRENSICSSLYVDYGQGFSESEKINASSALDEGKFRLNIRLDNARTIRAIRWDPVEYRFCRCIVQECLLDKREIKAIPFNSDRMDETLFLNVDPQFNLDIRTGKYSELEIYGRFEYLQDDFIKKKIESAEQHVTILLAENDVLREEYEAMKRTLAASQDELLNAQNELGVTRTDLSIIKNSKGWRMLNAWRRWRRA